MGRQRQIQHVDLHEVFLHIQEQMLANLSASGVFSHKSACGAATEQHWIDLFNRYLPQRYRATRAFVIDADGSSSHQIDIAICDRFYSPVFFHSDEQPYIPAESVYAVFEVKQTLSSLFVLDAGRKARSVRRLRRTSAPLLPAGAHFPPRQQFPILGGVLSFHASWPRPFAEHIPPLLDRLKPEERLDMGCSLRQGSFDVREGGIQFSRPDEALIFFMLRLIQRLQEMGAAPAIDFAEYSRCLQ